MRFNSKTLLTLSLCCVSILKAYSQAGFYLTNDINVQTDANPSNKSISYPPLAYAVLNNVMYFSANDGTHGNELWSSDGTPGGTHIVKNLESGAGSSNPEQIIVAGNKLFFITNNQTSYGQRLWCSDGTAKGTLLLKDSLFYSSPSMLTNVNGEVYFFLSNYPQLWKTDGTVHNTVMVKDFGNSAYSPYYLTPANGLLYFSIYTFANGRELWRSDGTDAGTFLLKDVNPINYYDYTGPSHFTSYNNKLYFIEYDGTGSYLWYTDGTSNGTIKVNNQDSIYIVPADNYSSLVNEPFEITNGKLIMAASTNSTGEEIFKYDTTNGFFLLRDISPGLAGGYIFSFTKIGKKVYFIYRDTLTHTDDIWSTDGSASKTFLVTSFAQGNLYNSQLSAGNNNLLYFLAYSKNYGNELWKSNGVAGNANMVKNIYSGSTSSNPQCITTLNDKVFFTAASDTSGTELWETDGTSINTFKVSEINSSYTASSAPSAPYSYNLPNNFQGNNLSAAQKNTLYFPAYKPNTGFELYKSNGTSWGTLLAKDILTGEAASKPTQFLTKGKSIYFIAEDTSYFRTVFKIDSLGKIKKVIPVNASFYDVADNGLIFFMTYDNITSTTQLWRSDGTINGTFELTDKIYFNNSAHQTLRTSGNKAFFVGHDEAYGYELWVSDGTVNGTGLVKDIATGTFNSSPYSLIPFKNLIFFGARDNSSPYASLWKSDGTSSGTIKINDVTPWGTSYYSNSPDNYNNYFCIVDNNLFFAGSNNIIPATGLWKTDGNTSGTVFLSSLGNASFPLPSLLTNLNGTLIFTSNQKDLWKSNGTSAGTKFLKSISSNSHVASERCVAGNKVFFITNNPDSALWISDGTISGTQLIKDSVLSGLTNIRNLSGTDSSVFFDGYNLKYGDELYSAVVSNVSHLKSVLLSSIQKEQNDLTVRILGNPVTSKINLELHSRLNGKVNLIISDVKGIPILQKQYDLTGSNLNASIDCSRWINGLYIIKLIGSNNDAISIAVLKE